MTVAQRTRAADDDLRDIAFQIAVESGRLATAERIIDELIDSCDELAKLSTLSQLGSEATELGIGIRLFTCRRWVIVFRYIDDGVLILRIVDGSQDYLAWKL
jgi:plasmid stabilization system protein ParE